MANIDELFNSNVLLNYYQTRQIPPMLGESLFPAMKIQDIEFDMITGADGLPVSASIHAFDTETELASREAIQKGAASLALIKRKIRIGEKDLIKINTPRTNAEQQLAIQKLFNDSDKMVQAVQTRAEAMRMELLSTGKININENGVAVELDYKVPEANTKTFDWSDPKKATPLVDIQTLAQAVQETSGVLPTRALTSTKVLNQILSAVSVKKAIFGVNSDKIATRNDLNTLLTAMELPTIAVYDAKYRVLCADGKYTTKRYFNESSFTVFGPDKVGDSVFGLTAEEIELIGDNKMSQAEMVGNIFVGVEKETDPVARFTKAAATFLPSLVTGNTIGIATIQEVSKAASVSSSEGPLATGKQ